MLKVLVTGAGGFVGLKVCQHLKKKKLKIIATYKDNKVKIQNIIHQRFDIYKKKKNFYEFFNKPSILIHLAWPDLDDFNSKNHLKKILPAQKIFLKNIIKNGLKNLVVAGTCFEYAKKNGKHSELDKTKPLTNYGKSKDLLRKFLFKLRSKYKFNLTWARIFYMYGKNFNRNTITNLIINSNRHKKYVLLNKNIKRDFLDVNEVANRIVLLALKKKNFGIVNICSGKEFTLKSLVKILKSKYKIQPLVKYKNIKNRIYEPNNFCGDTNKFNKIFKINY
jgi:nucleoside-diphosphate-sugar epimerase